MIIFALLIVLQNVKLPEAQGVSTQTQILPNNIINYFFTQSIAGILDVAQEQLSTNTLANVSTIPSLPVLMILLNLWTAVVAAPVRRPSTPSATKATHSFPTVAYVRLEWRQRVPMAPS